MKKYIVSFLGLTLSCNFAYSSMLNYSRPVKFKSQDEIKLAKELAFSRVELELLEKETDLVEQKLKYTQKILIKERLDKKTVIVASNPTYNPPPINPLIKTVHLNSIGIGRQINTCLLVKVKKIVRNSPISARRWIELSQELDFPLDFLLASGKIESHFGTRGRAVQTRNIFNVGNTDGGDYKAVRRDSFNSFNNSYEEGVVKLTKLIRDCYFYENERPDLKLFIERDFRAVRCLQVGKRYMSDRFAKYKYRLLSKKYRSLKIV